MSDPRIRKKDPSPRVTKPTKRLYFNPTIKKMTNKSHESEAPPLLDPSQNPANNPAVNSAKTGNESNKWTSLRAKDPSNNPTETEPVIRTNKPDPLAGKVVGRLTTRVVEVPRMEMPRKVMEKATDDFSTRPDKIATHPDKIGNYPDKIGNTPDKIGNNPDKMSTSSDKLPDITTPIPEKVTPVPARSLNSYTGLNQTFNERFLPKSGRDFRPIVSPRTSDKLKELTEKLKVLPWDVKDVKTYGKSDRVGCLRPASVTPIARKKPFVKSASLQTETDNWRRPDALRTGNASLDDRFTTRSVGLRAEKSVDVDLSENVLAPDPIDGSSDTGCDYPTVAVPINININFNESCAGGARPKKIGSSIPKSVANWSMKVDDERTARSKCTDKSRRRKGMYLTKWPSVFDAKDGAGLDRDNWPDAGQSARAVSDMFPSNLCTANSSSTSSLSNIPSNISSNQSSNSSNMSSIVSSNIPSNHATFPPKYSINSTNSISSNSSFNSASTALPSMSDLPTTSVTPLPNPLIRVDSFSESDPDLTMIRKPLSDKSDVSDGEASVASSALSTPRRFSKRPLRGPYGQMLQAEMNKSPESDKMVNFNRELKFIDDLTVNGQERTFKEKRPYDAESLKSSTVQWSVEPFPEPLSRSQSVNEPLLPRATSPSKLDAKDGTCTIGGLNIAMIVAKNPNDTRTHIVVELYETETIYVESLEILITRYLEPLKATDGLLDASQVDEIFYQVPQLLSHHEKFLDDLRNCLDEWDVKQKIGGVFIAMFSKASIVETYRNYVNNLKNAREIIKAASHARPNFAKFLETLSRENKGKFAIDSLLIKPIQKIPKYEMLLQRLIKHTATEHPDYELLNDAHRYVHEFLLQINCIDPMGGDDMKSLREIEALVEGLGNLVSPDRQFLRYDHVKILTENGARKDRGLFLFNDLLIITSIKRKTNTVRKATPYPTIANPSAIGSMEPFKYKLLMRLPLEDVDVVKVVKEDPKPITRFPFDVDTLVDDVRILNQIQQLLVGLHVPHEILDDVVKDLLSNTDKLLDEKDRTGDTHANLIEIGLNTSDGLRILPFDFAKKEARQSWAEVFEKAKLKLSHAFSKRPTPEFYSVVPIQKTRSGLQFTCAAPVRQSRGCLNSDLWICNSDCHVGQLCVLSFNTKPEVKSCSNICDARILCIASIPAKRTHKRTTSGCMADATGRFTRRTKSEMVEPDSSSESDADVRAKHSHSLNASFDDTVPCAMWIGTEDGCIYTLTCGENVRTRVSKLQIRHVAAVQNILYHDSRVFVSLACGDVVVYTHDHGSWTSTEPIVLAIATPTSPILKMLVVNKRIWCAAASTVKVMNTQTLLVEQTFVFSGDNNRQLSCMAASSVGVWIATHNSSVIKCYGVTSYEVVCEVNVASTVNKMLSSCDDIIRQHKAACLRVTALYFCKDLLWIGTSAGVLLTVHIPSEHASTHAVLPHASHTQPATPISTQISSQTGTRGLSLGHTGHVRFITSVPYKNLVQTSKSTATLRATAPMEPGLVVVSGGDGYEDFRYSSASELAGREDSTNHLLLWKI